MFYLVHFFLQCQNDPSLEIKDEPEAWSVTVDKKVPVPKYFYTCIYALFQTPLPVFQLAKFFSARREPAEYQGKEGNLICSCRQIVLKLSA